MIDPEKFEGVPDINKISGNEGLPNGARKFEDQEATKLLQEVWDKQVAYYKECGVKIEGGLNRGKENTRGLKRFEIEISGQDSKTFQGKLHPRVEGHSWFRGIAIKSDTDNPNNLVLIFSGWMDPKTEGCTLPPIVYTLGHVPDQTVRMIIYGYATNISFSIDVLRHNPNQSNK